MKELIKSNRVKENQNLLEVLCTEQSVSGCPKLTCFCKHIGSSNDSIEDESEILF